VDVQEGSPKGKNVRNQNNIEMVQNRVNPCVVGSRSRGEEKLKKLVDDLGRNQKKIRKEGGRMSKSAEKQNNESKE